MGFSKFSMTAASAPLRLCLSRTWLTKSTVLLFHMISFPPSNSDSFLSFFLQVFYDADTPQPATEPIGYAAKLAQPERV